MNLSIKQLIYFSLLFWILNTLWSIYAITPNVDDAFYFMPSLGLAHLNKLAFHINDYEYYDFSKFPTFPFLHGIFIKLLLFLDIPLNFYTYRLFPFINFFLLIFITFKFIGLLEVNKKEKNFKKLLFLILISITPFSMLYMSNRPEVLGLFFLITGIFFYLKSRKTYFNKNINLFLAGTFLSLSITTHPIFLFLIFFLISFIFIKNFKFKFISYFILGFFIPITFFLFFYYRYFPFSTDQLFMISSGFPYFGYFFSHIKNIFSNENFFINFVNFYYFIPYTLILLFLLLFFAKKILVKNFLLNDTEYINLSLLISVFLILFVERSTFYNHAVLAFVVLFSFITENYKKINISSFNRYSFKHFPNFFYIILLFFVICSWNIVHTIKYSYFPNQYLLNGAFLKFKNLVINKNKFIVTRPEFFPFFIKEINQNYLSNFTSPDTYWAFLSGRANTKNNNIFSKDFIKKSFFNQKNDEYFWIIAKKDVNKDNNDFICFGIHDSIGSNPLFIKLENYSVEYNTIKYLILKSNKFSLEC